ncbi:unnamed protein product [Rangifer tarandus platyrhynchus]|uniref:Uncharacterized protein n=1 Tax=Rangifer tarandus platyrhynchus TaxID=3082113 RepID=A0ABN8Z6M5_RANTA|nr:unnamed protein product [Rangifer tarandus platyrhynchus]CAI9687947.1 unnamed protein product [Rangifer tarandus platyrhynchus]
MPGPGSGSPLSVSLQDKRQQGRQPGSSKPARRDPSSRTGPRKKSFGKGRRTTVHFQRPLLGKGQSPYATARLGAPDGRWGAPRIFLDLQ